MFYVNDKNYFLYPEIGQPPFQKLRGNFHETGYLKYKKVESIITILNK